MNKEISPEELAKQLRCPNGKYAKQIGETMFLSNSNMIFKTIDLLQIQPESSILEIGFGNGQHLNYLLNKAPKSRYVGIDHSKEMIKEATQNNFELIQGNLVQFLWINSKEKPNFNRNSFDYCFTVNTIYFIDNLEEYLGFVFDFLKPNGKFAIGFIEKGFAEKMSFTQSIFRLYTCKIIEKILLKNGFKNLKTFDFTENTTSKDGRKIIRPFTVIVVKK